MISYTVSLNKSFTELTASEMLDVDGGINWGLVGTAALVTLGCVAIAAAPIVAGFAIAAATKVTAVTVISAVGEGLVLAGTGATIVGVLGMK